MEYDFFPVGWGGGGDEESDGVMELGLLNSKLEPRDTSSLKNCADFFFLVHGYLLLCS